MDPVILGYLIGWAIGTALGLGIIYLIGFLVWWCDD